jgi:RNase H-fold protein (predicted Holliday junction resolvase)
VCEKLDDKMNENMSVVQRQVERVSQEINQEILVLKSRLASKRASEELTASAGSSEQNTVTDVNSASQTPLLHRGVWVRRVVVKMCPLVVMLLMFRYLR